MPNPILSLPPRWGVNQKYEALIDSVSLGDGYSLIAPIGLGTLDENWEIESPALNQNDAIAAKQLFEQLVGVDEFDWSPDSVSPRKTYRVSSWKITPAGLGLWRLSATFENVGNVTIEVFVSMNSGARMGSTSVASRSVVARSGARLGSTSKVPGRSSMSSGARLGSRSSARTILILDNAVGVQNAYSLRLISSAYTGAAIRVRRSSDNTEQDIGFTSTGGLNTTALLAFVGSGNGFIKTWYDQSGNGRNATMTNTGQQPQIVSSGSTITLNGKPAVQFLGIAGNSNAWTALDATTSITGNTALSCLVATMNSNTQLAGRLLALGASGQNAGSSTQYAVPIERYLSNNQITSERNATNGAILSISLDTGFQASSVFDSSGNTTYLNGASGSTASGLTGAFNVSLLRIGQDTIAPSATAAWNGKISEVIVCNSTTSRSSIEADQKAYFGTP